MFFFYVNQLNELCVCAQFYLVLKLFIRNYFPRMSEKMSKDPAVLDFLWSSAYTYCFTIAYCFVIVLTIIMSVVAPLNKFQCYFKCVNVLLSCLTTFFFMGILFLISIEGVNPKKMIYDEAT